jgi:hypothetical protein
MQGRRRTTVRMFAPKYVENKLKFFPFRSRKWWPIGDQRDRRSA